MDCDLLAVVLDQDGKVPRRYDLAFYNQKTDRSKAIRHLADDILNIKGQESLLVNMKELPDYCWQIVFILAVYEADCRNQSLGMVKRLQMELEGGDGESHSFGCKKICQWNGKAAAVAAKLQRQFNGTWRMEGPDGTVFDDWHATAIFVAYGLERWKE